METPYKKKPTTDQGINPQLRLAIAQANQTLLEAKTNILNASQLLATIYKHIRNPEEELKVKTVEGQEYVAITTEEYERFKQYENRNKKSD
jgi:hypothetical protein